MSPSIRAGVITNVEADVNLDAGRVKSLLIEQAVQPVRWERIGPQARVSVAFAYGGRTGKVLRV
jgi:hypothetical protein